MIWDRGGRIVGRGRFVLGLGEVVGGGVERAMGITLRYVWVE